MRSKQFYFLIQFLMGAALTSNAFASSGGNSSGGGFACIKSQNSVLVDLVAYDPTFQDSAGSPQVKFGNIGEALGYELHSASEFEAYPLAMEKLKQWESNSPFTIGLIEEALQNLKWRITEHALATPDETYSSPAQNLTACQNITPVVTYTNLLGAVTDLNMLNRLGKTSQSALLIHEALRRVQFLYSEGQSTENLQKITATVMLADPASAQTLDSEAYLSGDLLKNAQSKGSIKARRISLFKQACALDSSYSFCSTTIPTDGLLAFQLDNRMFEVLNATCMATTDTNQTTRIDRVAQGVYDLLTDENRAAISANTAPLLEAGVSLSNWQFQISEAAIFDYLETGKAPDHHAKVGIKKAIKTIRALFQN